jgi:hypothetical protein
MPAFFLLCEMLPGGRTDRAAIRWNFRGSMRSRGKIVSLIGLLCVGLLAGDLHALVFHPRSVIDVRVGRYCVRHGEALSTAADEWRERRVAVACPLCDGKYLIPGNALLPSAHSRSIAIGAQASFNSGAPGSPFRSAQAAGLFARGPPAF